MVLQLRRELELILEAALFRKYFGCISNFRMEKKFVTFIFKFKVLTSKYSYYSNCKLANF